MASVKISLQRVNERISTAASRCGRDARDISLVAVSKTHPAATLRAAHAAGQRDFGENYVQEAIAKMDALADLDLAWHFIGPIQSNKTRDIAARFHWVHSVDRARVAQRLSAQRAHGAPRLDVCVQVNLSDEATKSGCTPEEVRDLAHVVAALPNLRLRGLMTVPEPTADTGLQFARFARLTALRDRLNADGLGLDTLSMGMSDDLEAAIAAGSTMVRIGTAIFGPRETRLSADAAS
jgi:hypothetical protein